MIVIGYEIKLPDAPFFEYIEDSRHDNNDDAVAAMLSLRKAQKDNDDVLQFFYGVATSDTEYKINLVLDVDTPILPDAPEVAE